MIGKPIVRSEGADSGPSYGAARLVACGVNALTLSDLGDQPPTTDRFEPVHIAGLYERLARFRRFYNAASAAG